MHKAAEEIGGAPGARANYGVDAPGVLRNLLLAGVACLVGAWLLPPVLRVGGVAFLPRPMFWGTGAVLLIETGLFVLYVKQGKFGHRDRMLGLHAWRGDEQILDVGCGRGLLLVGGAKRAPRGAATGLDIWSSRDMGGNSEAATQRNLVIEGVADRCKLVTGAAQSMPFASAAFDVVVSNLCLHNIYHGAERQKALAEIARVLKPGGQAILSDYKLTGEYARALAAAGCTVTRQWGNFATTFPPLRIVVATRTAAPGPPAA